MKGTKVNKGIVNARVSFAAAAAAVAIALAFVAATLAPAGAAHAAEGLAGDSTALSTTAYRVVATPAAPKIDGCIAAGAGKITVHASAVQYAQGYEFQVSTSKGFKSGVKAKKVKSYGMTFSGLKKGQKYYVRVRAYQSSAKVCTKWSSKASAKTGIAYKKSKVAGKWKVAGIDGSPVSTALYFTFSKDGKIISGSASETKTLDTKWVATGKKAGFEFAGYKKYGTIKLSGSTLSMRYSTGKTYTFKKA